MLLAPSAQSEGAYLGLPRPRCAVHVRPLADYIAVRPSRAEVRLEWRHPPKEYRTAGGVLPPCRPAEKGDD